MPDIWLSRWPKLQVLYNLPDSIFQVAYFTGTVITGFCVSAVLTLIITVMVSIHTLVLWGTGSVCPGGGTLGLFGPQVNCKICSILKSQFIWLSKLFNSNNRFCLIYHRILYIKHKNTNFNLYFFISRLVLLTQDK